MALMVQAAAMLTVTGIGALAFWRSGVTLDDMRNQRNRQAGSAKPGNTEEQAARRA